VPLGSLSIDILKTCPKLGRKITRGDLAFPCPLSIVLFDKPQDICQLFPEMARTL
jgi:hypothetical protein